MNTAWKLDKKISLSVLAQLLTLAGLILGSWLNLQRQLDSLGRDVKLLLQTQDKFCDKMERLHERTTAHEYRIQSLEKEN